MPRIKFCSSPPCCDHALPAPRICGFRRGWGGLRLSRFGDEAAPGHGAPPWLRRLGQAPSRDRAGRKRGCGGRAAQSERKRGAGGRPSGVGTARASPRAPLAIAPLAAARRDRGGSTSALRGHCPFWRGRGAPGRPEARRTRGWRFDPAGGIVYCRGRQRPGFASMAVNLEPDPLEAGGFRAWVAWQCKRQ
jgi:hypothetical protein